MAIEIERKFQVVSGDWRSLVTETSEMVQGYFLGGKKVWYDCVAPVTVR